MELRRVGVRESLPAACKRRWPVYATGEREAKKVSNADGSLLACRDVVVGGERVRHTLWCALSTHLAAILPQAFPMSSRALKVEQTRSPAQARADTLLPLRERSARRLATGAAQPSSRPRAPPLSSKAAAAVCYRCHLGSLVGRLSSAPQLCSTAPRRARVRGVGRAQRGKALRGPRGSWRLLSAAASSRAYLFQSGLATRSLVETCGDASRHACLPPRSCFPLDNCKPSCETVTASSLSVLLELPWAVLAPPSDGSARARRHSDCPSYTLTAVQTTGCSGRRHKKIEPAAPRENISLVSCASALDECGRADAHSRAAAAPD